MANNGRDLFDPTIARFLRSYPALKAPVEKLLELAAAVRAARGQALPEPEPRGPVHGAEFFQAERELVAALEDLEQRVRRPGSSSSEVLATTRRIAAALMEMRAEGHTLSPRRTTRSPEAREELFRALRAFASAFADLERRARQHHVPRIPWQVELSTHVEATTPVRDMELWGYQLPGTPASRKPWGERCFLSRTQWNVDRHVGAAVRFRSLDHGSHTLAPKYHALFARLRGALDALRGDTRQAVERIARLFPSLYEEYVPETSSPAFTRLGLLDFPSLAVSLNNLLRAYAKRPLFGDRDQEGAWPTLGVADRSAVALDGATSGYTWRTYDEIRTLALRLAHAFEALAGGDGRGDRVVILASRNCREYYLADFAAIFAGLVSVALPDTMADEEVVSVIGSTRPSLAVADTASLSRLSDLAGKCSKPPPVAELETLLDVRVPDSWTSRSGVSLDTGIVYGDAAGYSFAAARGIAADTEDDLYTILYTSGSTGTPKGSVVTRRRWAEEMCFEADVWPYVGVSFQPCAVAADRASVWRALANGGRVGFARRGAAFFHDVRAIRPTLLDAPPVIWNALYTEYKSAISDPGLTRREAARIRLRFKRSLGGRLVFMAIGGAPSDPGVRRTMEEIFGVPMKEGYGTTETGNVAADGRLLPGLDYRLVDLPDLGFSAADKPHPRGELAVRTPRTTPRYWEDDDATQSGFTDDGYFRTGDVVEIGPDRQVRILGRRKELFKLAGSEFVSPERLERFYSTSERVEAVWVTGSPLQKSVVAVVVPANDGVGQAEVLADFRAIARREGLRPGEVPAGVVVVPRIDAQMPWTSENGLLTASLKLNRRALEERYGADVDAVYSGAKVVMEPGGGQRELGSPDISQVAAACLGLQVSEIDTGRSFLEHGGESVTAMEFVLRLEQVFAGKGEAEQPWRQDPKLLVSTPLAQVARRLLPIGRPADPTGVRREAARPTTEPVVTRPSPDDETTLANADALAIPKPDPLPPQSTENHVFLTGATGFLGVHLLAHLCASLPPERRIYALVRAKDAAAARERLTRALSRAALEAPAIGVPGNEGRARVIALAGSLAENRLGLSPELHARLAEDIGLIYHVAAEVSFAKSYGELRDGNVVGTRRLLELATLTTLKALHFVSSLNVALLLRQVGGGTVFGSTVFEGSRLARLLAPRITEAQPGYGISKWVCERMIGELADHCRGAFRASVSRPALIVWSGSTGVANDGDWLTRVLTSCLAMRLAIGPEEAGTLKWVPETATSARGLDMVPVDFVARALSRIGESTRTSSLPAPDLPTPNPVPTFHVSNVAPAHTGHTTLSHLMDLLAAADFLELVPFSDWALRAEMESAAVLPILPQLRQMSPMLERTEAERFARVLAMDPPEACPPVDRSLVEVFVRRYRDVTSHAS